MDNLNTIDPYADLDSSSTLAVPQPTAPLSPALPTEKSSIQADPYADLGGRIANEQEQAELKYGDWKSKTQGAVTAIAEGLVSRPVVAAAEKALGITEEESRQKKMALGKGVATGLEFGAMIAPAVMTLGSSALAKVGLLGAAETAAKVATLGEFTNAGILNAVGKKAVEKLGTKGAVASLAVAGGIENALFAIEDETAKAIKGDPNSVNQALWNVGLSGALGAGVGGALGKASDLWVNKYGPAAKEFAKDFQKTQKDIVSGNMPAADAVAEELQQVYNTTEDLTKTVSGASGLKRQDIARLLPQESTEAMRETSGKILGKVDDFVRTVKSEPGIFKGANVTAVEQYGERLLYKVVDPSTSPIELFKALDDFKQSLGPLTKWDARLMQPIEKEGSVLVKNLYNEVKIALENESVWGMAGKRQKEINEAVSNYFKKIKGFKRTAMALGAEGEAMVSPDKLQTIINQARKGKAGLRQDFISSYLDAVDELYNAINKSDQNLGVLSSVEKPPMTAARAVTQKWTPGMKAAYTLYNQTIDAASEAAGAAAGYKIGKVTGIPGAEWAAAMFGHYAFKPIAKTIMPVLINPILGAGLSGVGMKAASQTINAIGSGNVISKMAADALFLDKEVPRNKKSTPESLKRLDDKLQEIQRNPQSLIDLNEHLYEGMPNQASALTAATTNAVSYLNEKRPKPRILSPLDAEKQPSKIEMQDYYRTLEIADNPLVMLQKIKNGTLKSKDVIDFQAMYPTLYNDIQMKVIDSLALHKSQNKIIPYRLRKSLSIFAGQPLDVNSRPESIQAAQAVFQPQQEPQQQALPQMAKKSSRKSQVPDMTQTDQQRRMTSR
jgi:hypothetical protein